MEGIILNITTRSTWNFLEFDPGSHMSSRPTYTQTAALAPVERSAFIFGLIPQSTSTIIVSCGLIITLCEYHSTSLQQIVVGNAIAFSAWQRSNWEFLWIQPLFALKSEFYSSATISFESHSYTPY